MTTRPKAAWSRWRKATLVGLSLAGAAVVLVILVNPDLHGLDARGYWSFDPADPYAGARGNLSAVTAFRYAPPIAQFFIPLQALPWPVFVTLWTLVCLAALVVLSGRWALALAALYPIAIELSAGNVNLLIGAAALIGFRWPAVWSFVLLTKISPGVGLLWFAFRREWRALLVVAATTGLVSLVSWVLAPHLWPLWFDALGSMVGLEPEGLHVPVPLPIRLAIAAVVVAWGARTGRRWTVLVAVTLAMPSIWMASLSPLAGLVRTGSRRTEGAPATGPTPSLALSTDAAGGG